MGLLIDGSDYAILSDIQGLEDHYGDMDFKVAGTEKGITALQLDIKVSGLSTAILTEALAQAKVGRLHILNCMLAVIAAPRGVVSPNAPKIEHIMIDPEKVGLIIGPGGKMIRKIEEESGASVTVSDGTAGQVCISAVNQDSLDIAKRMILGLAKSVEPGEQYEGRVTKIMAFGAFIEVLPGKEGLMHISTMTNSRLSSVDEVLRVGQILSVRVREIDGQNRINLVPVTLLDA
jgi:polyribonucleotide nucleotidyltransferase